MKNVVQQKIGISIFDGAVLNAIKKFKVIEVINVLAISMLQSWSVAFEVCRSQCKQSVQFGDYNDKI